LEAAKGYTPYISTLDLFTTQNTPAAEDALVHIDPDKGIGVAVNLEALAFSSPGREIDLIFISKILELAGAA
jgi:hypothetical protein